MDYSLIPDADDVPAEHALFVLDMKEYSRIPEARMASARAVVDDIVSAVLAQCGIGDVRTLDGAVKDRGDGAVYVLPARHTARLIDPLLSRLGQALAQHDRTRPASSPSIRLRVSIHVGPLEPPHHHGDAIVHACRLVDSGAARTAMVAAVGHDLMLAATVSEAAFDRSVRSGRTKSLQPRHFLPATALVEDKPGFRETCWIHVPGLVPSAIAPHLTAEEDMTPVSADDSAGRPGPGGRSGSEPGAVHQRGSASDRSQVTQVGRDYITGRTRE